MIGARAVWKKDKLVYLWAGSSSHDCTSTEEALRCQVVTPGSAGVSYPWYFQVLFSFPGLPLESGKGHKDGLGLLLPSPAWGTGATPVNETTRTPSCWSMAGLLSCPDSHHQIQPLVSTCRNWCLGGWYRHRRCQGSLGAAWTKVRGIRHTARLMVGSSTQVLQSRACTCVRTHAHVLTHGPLALDVCWERWARDLVCLRYCQPQKQISVSGGSFSKHTPSGAGTERPLFQNSA